MKLAALLPLALSGPAAAFSLSMNGGRSPLAQQYKSIMSVHNGLSAANNYPRMAPPGEPEPEVDPRRKNPDEQPQRGPVTMPVVDAESGQKDVISRLLQDRIILLGQGVDDEIANVLVAQLLYLANEDPTKDITLYINSPGGSVSAGMAIYDTMQVRAPLIYSHCVSYNNVLNCNSHRVPPSTSHATSPPSASAWPRPWGPSSSGPGRPASAAHSPIPAS